MLRPADADTWQHACDLRDRWSAVIDASDGACQRDFGMRACDALRSTDVEACSEARRQLVALRLNVRSGRLSPGCRLRAGGTVADAARRAFAMRRRGDCEEARDLARGLNTGRLLQDVQPCTPSSGIHEDLRFDAAEDRQERRDDRGAERHDADDERRHDEARPVRIPPGHAKGHGKKPKG